MSRLIYVVTEDGLSFLAEAYSMCVCTTYPFISWWEFWLILYLSYYEHCWNEHGRIDVSLTYWFHTFVSMPGSVIAGLYSCLDLSDNILKIFFKMCVVIFCKSIDSFLPMPSKSLQQPFWWLWGDIRFFDDFFLWDVISVCNPHWPPTHKPPISASQVRGLPVSASYKLHHGFYLHFQDEYWWCTSVMCFLVICICSLSVLQKVFCRFLKLVYLLSHTTVKFLCVLDIDSVSDVQFDNILSYPIGHLFILLTLFLSYACVYHLFNVFYFY